MKNFLLTLGLLLSFYTFSFAQSVTLTGRIVDDLGLALTGAHIMILDQQAATVSDDQGEFTLTGLSEGSPEIKITYLGFQDYNQVVNLTEGTTNSLQVTLNPGVIMGTEILFIGEALRGQAMALSQQRRSDHIVNIVAAEQIGKFPDSNIGDAIKRLPGVNVIYDQGEARFGLIRGTEARLNSVTLNGDRLPSAEAETRVVQLDLIPADMIKTIEASKAVLPDMDGDAIGGSVNLVTRAAPSRLRFSSTVGGGYNFLAEKPLGLASFVVGQRFAKDKLGLMLSASYHNHQLGADNIEAEWEENGTNAYMTDFQIRRYDVQRIRQSVAFNTDYRLSNTDNLIFEVTYNHRNDFENRYRLRYRFDKGMDGGIPNAAGQVEETAIVRQTKGGSKDNDYERIEDQRVFNIALRGKHLLADKYKLNWSGSFARATEERPEERYLQYSTLATAIPNITDLRLPQATFLNSNDNAPANFELDELIEENRSTNENDVKFKVDFNMPLVNKVSSLKAGIKYKAKTKVRDNTYFEYTPIDTLLMNNLGAVEFQDYSDDNYNPGNYPIGNMATREFLGDLDLNNPSRFAKDDVLEEYAGGNFEAQENVFAAYVRYDHDFSEKLKLITGIRMENTSIDYTGNEYNLDDATVTAVNNTANFLNIMPGLHLRYNLGQRSNLRFAWTNTIARPNYFDLVPYRQVSIDDGELSEGNPELKPTTSMNFDILAEQYFENVGYVSGGIFFKAIDKFIFSYQEADYFDPTSNTTFDTYITPQNGGSASLFGIELAFQRQLDFIGNFGKNLGIYANYTFTNSSIDGLPVEGREDDNLVLPGSAEHTINGSLSFEKNGIKARISLNYSSAFLEADGVGQSAFYDRYYDSALNVDFNAGYKVNEQFRVFLEANNLTNQPLRYYQGVEERMMQLEYFKMRITAGVKFDLNKKK